MHMHMYMHMHMHMHMQLRAHVAALDEKLLHVVDAAVLQLAHDVHLQLHALPAQPRTAHISQQPSVTTHDRAPQ